MKNESIDLKTYLKSKTVLIVTESGTDRVAWKKLLVEIGLPAASFQTATKVSDAINILKTKEIDIVFCSYIVGDQDAFPIIESHIEKYPNRSDYFCFMASEKNSLALAAVAAENDVDGLLVKPYNNQDLQDTITNSLQNAVVLSKECRNYFEILGYIRSKDLDKALTQVENYIINRPESPNGYFLKGIVQKQNDKINDALDTWKLGLSKDAKHHKILCSLMDTYCEIREFEKSYEYAEALTKEYPINPVRIPDIIRSSLATKNYKNLIQFCEMIVSVDDDLIASKKPIAAALAISGKHLLSELNKENRNLIIQASRKAIELSGLNSKIALGSMHNLIQLDKFEVVKDYIDQIPSDELSLELLSVELQVVYGLEAPDSVFIKAQNLVKVNKTTPRIYEILLITAKQLGKTTDQIEDMLFEGIKLFPDYKTNFESLVH